MSVVDTTDCPRCATATTHVITAGDAIQLCHCRICQADFHAPVDRHGRFSGRNTLATQDGHGKTGPDRSHAGNRE